MLDLIYFFSASLKNLARLLGRTIVLERCWNTKKAKSYLKKYLSFYK
jgi:hypothetical protein